MLEKKVCSEYTDAEQNQTEEIIIHDFFKRELKFVERFLGIIVKKDVNLIERLLLKYKEILAEMNISSDRTKLNEQFTSDYSEYKLVTEYSEFIPLIENAILHFLHFSNYENQLSEENKIVALKTDTIRGEFHPFYYLVFSLIDIISRDATIELAKEFTDLSYELRKDQILKHGTLEEYAKSLYNGICPKNQNYIWMVQGGKYFLKTTRCMWGEVYSDLPDLELANYLECYGDFSKMPYINPNFALSRTKTIVEGHPYCDFVFYDKRIVNELEHPDEEFWKNF